MSVGANTDWGRTFETAACDRLQLDDVAHDPDHPRVDARTTRAIRPGGVSDALKPSLRFADPVPSGAAVAAKACKHRIRDGQTTRRGRWAIYRSELDHADAFALGVYTPDYGVLPQLVAILPTEEIADRLGDWSESPNDQFEQVARLPWSAVFVSVDPAEVPDA